MLPGRKAMDDVAFRFHIIQWIITEYGVPKGTPPYSVFTGNFSQVGYFIDINVLTGDEAAIHDL